MKPAPFPRARRFRVVVIEESDTRPGARIIVRGPVVPEAALEAIETWLRSALPVVRAIAQARNAVVELLEQQTTTTPTPRRKRK